MSYSTSRLDRFISQHSAFSKSEVRLLLAQNRVTVDGTVAHSAQHKVSKFSRVELDGLILQASTPVYLMLHKPQGVVSATKDGKHSTALDLLDHPLKYELHIAGRLDFNTTGLLLLTNDGSWSREISLPKNKLMKVYEVSLAKPLNDDYIAAFQQGIYFAYENIITQPAHLEILSEYSAKLTLTEGKYHQVKRMFGFFQNEVLSLHRASVGPLVLDGLAPGQSRLLTANELMAVARELANTN